MRSSTHGKTFSLGWIAAPETPGYLEPSTGLVFDNSTAVPLIYRCYGSRLRDANVDGLGVLAISSMSSVISF
jgi:hypothetical protein